MAHPEQKKFLENTQIIFEKEFRIANKILEVGSQNINGTVRDFFLNAELFVGIDIGDADMVDYVIPGELLELPDGWGDIVISTECLEHCEAWKQVFINMIRIVKPYGLVLITCASLGRAAHGTLDSGTAMSPFTTSYYKNLSVDVICTQIDMSRFFSRHSFEVNAETGDLYFWGVRNQSSINSALYNFSSPEDRLARAQGQLAQAIYREKTCKNKIKWLEDSHAKQIAWYEKKYAKDLEHLKNKWREKMNTLKAKMRTSISSLEGGNSDQII